MFSIKPFHLGVGLLVLFLWARPTHAFGAGNIASISKVEGQNWRHGDIEDVLLQIMMARAAGGKKFSKLNVARVYFGNWLRDYSQAIDVGTVKSVSAEAIRLLLSILGFLTFGYGSGEFEVTADRLGCYRPEDHIDNPKNYADNEDARRYDRRLRGPVDEETELGIDPYTGMKNYIANERAGIMTSAQHIRNLFGRCIELGRRFNRTQNKPDKYEALRLLGTGLHCLEDFFAHSNYTELALIELGERDVFPHVGRRTRIRLHGARGEVYPLVTGTFGGVDFLHSVTGEVSDKLVQNEIEELEGTLDNSRHTDYSAIESLLDKIPDGLFGGGQKKQQVQEVTANAQAAQAEQHEVSPRDPEEYTLYVQGIFKQIMPAIETHDDIMKSIRTGIERVPVLPKIIEQLEEQLAQWVFSIMAPFVVPVLRQIKNELRTGSSEIIESSKHEQHVVFHDDYCSDPTHSMLSKDHFTNILNEIAGKTASKMVAWVVPQIMEAWDDESIDANRTISRIINGVLHHPAQRDMGDDGARDGRQILFRSVQQWWEEMDEGQRDDYRRKLSREGVESGHNHREGQHDSGHGCGKPLKMHKEFGSGGTMEDKIAGAAAGAIVGGITGGIASMVKSNTGVHIPSSEDHRPTDFGGAWNMLSSTAGVSSGGHGGGGGHGGDDGLGGIVGKMGSMFSGRGGGGSSRGMGGGETTYESSGYADDGGYNQEYSRTDYSEYGQREGSGGYGYEEHTESTWQSSSGDGYGGDSYAEQQPEESSGGGFGGGFSSMLRQASEAFGGGGGEEEYHEERRDEEESGGGGGWFS